MQSMAPRPWLSTTFADQKFFFWSHPRAFRSVCSTPDDVSPSIITFIGSSSKALYLSGLLGYVRTFERHGQIQLASRACKPGRPLDVFLDCEISLQSSVGLQSGTEKCLRRSIDWLNLDGNSAAEAQLQDHLITHVLTPLSNVVCYFAADLNGLKGVAGLLARQAILPNAHNLPSTVLPSILVVTNTRSKVFDTIAAQYDLRAQIIKEMTTLDPNLSANSAEQSLIIKIRGMHVIGLQKAQPKNRRIEQLNQRITDLSQESYWSRKMNRYLFNMRHTEVLADRMLQVFCNKKNYFNFLRESRPMHFDDTQLESHLKEVLGLIPDATWLWRIVIPLVSSAYCLASYPYGSHGFSSQAIFDEFFKIPAKRSISAYTTDAETHTKFVGCLEEKMEEIFRSLEFEPEMENALTQHSCLSCVMFMPDKVLQCGHAVCNVCIRRHGNSSKDQKHTFTIVNCPLCGYLQPKTQRNFRLIPPTAGIRALCIDGGGVKGVIPLVTLNHMLSSLKRFDSPIHEFFDYVCGTSAGGLITIGVFLMQWDLPGCLERFEQLAATMFLSKEQKEKTSFSQKVQQIFHAWLNDHRYNLSPIERAFQSNSFAKMFNPLQNDTKVAVTATSVRANVPCVIANYNGGPRSDDSNYSHIRAARCHHDMTISDAAACTSAAPFFFKSKDVNHLDTFQDGGLQHNNPALLASWELAIIWPDRCQIYATESCRIDHMISLGTGFATSAKHEVGPHTPKRDRFIRRLVGSFMRQLDGEEQWRTFTRCLPSEIRPRYHRVNVPLPGNEPALDDTEAIDFLKQEASLFMKNDDNQQLQRIKDTMIASSFYFEIDGLSHLEGGSYQCSGTIFCRLAAESSSHRSIYQWLLDTHAFFIIGSQRITCAQSQPEGNPVFRRSVTFIVGNMEEMISISITGVTTESTLISGMPVRVRSLIEAQCLDAPFGCIDNRETEKELPPRPLKRKCRDV